MFNFEFISSSSYFFTTQTLQLKQKQSHKHIFIDKYIKKVNQYPPQESLGPATFLLAGIVAFFGVSSVTTVVDSILVVSTLGGGGERGGE